MLKTVVIGTTALFLTASSIANAQSSQTSSPAIPERLNAADRNALTDMRVDLVKAALQLTPDQEKYWPAVEQAIRERAAGRQQRLEKLAATLGEQSERDPIAIMSNRADSLSQRGAELKKLTDAWQPLYESLDANQKGRLRFLAVYVLHELREARESRVEDEEDEE